MAVVEIGKSSIGDVPIATWNELVHERRQERIFMGSETPVSAASKRMNYALWIVQALLALVFLFAGTTKLILPMDVLTSMGSPNQIALPGLFLRFIGVAEVLGAIGLILPRLLRVRPGVTPLAASGLVIIMIGATAVTLAGGEVAGALVPFVVGLLSTSVAYGRWIKERNRLPSWLGRLVIGEAGMSMMTQARGSSNAKAKRLLNWKPEYRSWRHGFRQMLVADGKEPAASSNRLSA